MDLKVPDFVGVSLDDIWLDKEDSLELGSFPELFTDNARSPFFESTSTINGDFKRSAGLLTEDGSDDGDDLDSFMDEDSDSESMIKVEESSLLGGVQGMDMQTDQDSDSLSIFMQNGIHSPSAGFNSQAPTQQAGLMGSAPWLGGNANTQTLGEGRPQRKRTPAGKELSMTTGRSRRAREKSESYERKKTRAKVCRRVMKDRFESLIHVLQDQSLRKSDKCRMLELAVEQISALRTENGDLRWKVKKMFQTIKQEGVLDKCKLEGFQSLVANMMPPRQVVPGAMIMRAPQVPTPQIVKLSAHPKRRVSDAVGFRGNLLSPMMMMTLPPNLGISAPSEEGGSRRASKRVAAKKMAEWEKLQEEMEKQTRAQQIMMICRRKMVMAPRKKSQDPLAR